MHGGALPSISLLFPVRHATCPLDPWPGSLRCFARVPAGFGWCTYRRGEVSPQHPVSASTRCPLDSEPAGCTSVPGDAGAHPLRHTHGAGGVGAVGYGKRFPASKEVPACGTVALLRGSTPAGGNGDDGTSYGS